MVTQTSPHRSSYAGQAVDGLRLLALEALEARDGPNLRHAHELTNTLNGGPLAAAVSVNVVYRLLTAPAELHWLYLSYRRSAPRAVVIGGDHRECTYLHARAPAPDSDSNSYTHSLLYQEVLRNLYGALLGDAAYRGARSTTMLIIQHMLGLVTLGEPELRLYTESPTGSLGVLRENHHDTTDMQRAARTAHNAAHHALTYTAKTVVPLIAGLSKQESTALRAALSVIARAVAIGFVHLSTLDRFRSPDRTAGFIGKQALLARLALPSGYVLIDVTREEQEANPSVWPDS